MDWIFQTIQWYFYLFILGIAFFPLAKRLFGKFFDWGYPFSKTIGIIVLSYSAFVGGILHITPFTRWMLFVFFLLFAALNVYVYLKDEELRTMLWKKIPHLIFEEVLFLIALFFLAFVRGQEPSLHGLEKFMDFGFMNSILKSTHFPPLDMWYSAGPDVNGVNHPNGYPINYYYFGHLTGAMLIKFSGTVASIGYNLVLATIFAQGITLAFSLVANIVHSAEKALALLTRRYSQFTVYFIGLLGSFILNLGGNLHTIYLFTTGYDTDKPVPFWQILSTFNPSHYWYPNATRFIPYTIHEFPSYSYVVADLHGHVFDIPFVLLTLALLFSFFINALLPTEVKEKSKKKLKGYFEMVRDYLMTNRFEVLFAVLLGCMSAINGMTNASDGPIYLALSCGIFFLVYKLTPKFIINCIIAAVCFYITKFPFAHFFSFFVSGFGINCSPDFLVNIQKWGPFLFEKGNCQRDPWWMLVTLWGFFWVNFILLVTMIFTDKKNERSKTMMTYDLFALVLFALGTILIMIPERLYVKDIYPQHFRANTMFKLGYQAFIMMSIASAYTFYRTRVFQHVWKYALKVIFIFFFFFISIYPFFSFPSYYGNLNYLFTSPPPGVTPSPTQLDGAKWLETAYPEDKEIIDYINKNIKGQPIILEAQGDSYTDYDEISAYTGLPTVAGWWVHEWLWRGTADVVGKRIPDIQTMYESPDIQQTKDLLKKYHVQYVIVAKQERTKYANLNEQKFSKIGKKVFESSNGFGALYKVD